MNLTHSDERRELYSFPEGKMIVAKQDTVIGKHYHKIKTELFILSSGTCRLIIKVLATGEQQNQPMQIGRIYTIAPNTYHEFHLTKDAVLIGLNSHVYNPADDYYMSDRTNNDKC